MCVLVHSTVLQNLLLHECHRRLKCYYSLVCVCVFARQVTHARTTTARLVRQPATQLMVISTHTHTQRIVFAYSRQFRFLCTELHFVWLPRAEQSHMHINLNVTPITTQQTRLRGLAQKARRAHLILGTYNMIRVVKVLQQRVCSQNGGQRVQNTHESS